MQSLSLLSLFFKCLSVYDMWVLQEVEVELPFCIAVIQQRGAIIHQPMHLVSNGAGGMELKINNLLAAKHLMFLHIFILAVNAGEICRNS